jgi:hypothetical protein
VAVVALQSAVAAALVGSVQELVLVLLPVLNTP